MNGYLWLKLRVHAARVHHIVRNKVRWIFILAILVHVARRCNALTLKNLRREVFPAVFISRIEVLPLILRLYSCVRSTLKLLLTRVARSFSALRKACTWCEDLRVGWSIYIVVIDCILYLIVIAHRQFDRNITFFLAILLGRPGSRRWWVESDGWCRHSLSGFAVLSDRISVPSWATTVGEAKWWAALWHMITVFIQILHVRVDNRTKGCCVAICARVLVDSLVPVFILLLCKLLLSACTDTTFSLELQLGWVSFLVFIVRWRWLLFLSTRKHLIWTATWISSACIMRKSNVIWLSECLIVGTFAADVHIARWGNHHALHGVDVSNILNNTWSKWFMCLIAVGTFSLRPLQQLHVTVAHLVHTWPRIVTWVRKWRMFEHLSDTFRSWSETLINSTGVWQSGYLNQKLN